MPFIPPRARREEEVAMSSRFCSSSCSCSSGAHAVDTHARAAHAMNDCVQVLLKETSQRGFSKRGMPRVPSPAVPAQVVLMPGTLTNVLLKEGHAMNAHNHPVPCGAPQQQDSIKAAKSASDMYQVRRHSGADELISDLMRWCHERPPSLPALGMCQTVWSRCD
eukprot:907730-Pelagomonas_calceolata.AAC.4